MTYNWLSINGTLVDGAGGIAKLDGRALAEVAGTTVEDRASMRFNLLDWTFTVTVNALGAATNVTVEGLTSNGNWVSIATAQVVDDQTTLNKPGDPQYVQFRLTFTGSPDGAGEAGFSGQRKFNGRG